MRSLALILAAPLALAASPASACLLATEVRYGSNSLTLSTEGDEALQRFAGQILQGADAIAAVKITGYSDWWEHRTRHGSFAAERASFVSDRLASLGVPMGLLRIVEEPATAPTRVPRAERAAQRRVDLVAVPAPSAAPSPPGEPVAAC